MARDSTATRDEPGWRLAMAHSATPDYYELLGVSRDADVETITRAYRKLARVSHPDSGGNAGMFRLLRVAYETLTDETQRKAYDAALDNGLAPAADDHDHPVAPGVADDHDDYAQSQWTFDDGTTRSMVVDPERLSWWSGVDPSRATHVSPPYARGRWPALATGVTFTAFGLTIVGFHLIGVVPLIAGAAVLLGSYLRASRGMEVTAVVGVAGAIAVVSTGVYMYVAKPTFASLLGFGLLLSLAAGAVLFHRLGQAALLNLLAPPEAIEQREYGRPGAGRLVGEQARQFGDRIGADALLPLTCMPGIRVFHGLANFDGGPVHSHAVVCGRLVALVESMYWESGAYSWTPHGALLRDGQHFPDGDLGFDVAVATYQRALGEDVDVRGFVLVTSMDEGAVVGGTGPAGIMLGGPQAVVEELGNWFLRSGTTDQLDRNLLVRLYRHRAVADGDAP